MTTTEKLQRIRARCVKLLALAEKRTPGKWFYYLEPRLPITGECDVRPDDAAYIAACAGAAEAGWRATIAAIDSILRRGAEEGLESIEIRVAWEDLL